MSQIAQIVQIKDLTLTDDPCQQIADSADSADSAENRSDAIIFFKKKGEIFSMQIAQIVQIRDLTPAR